MGTRSAYLERRLEAVQAILGADAPLCTYGAALRLVSVANGSQGMSIGGQRFRAEKRKTQRRVGELAGRAFRPYLEGNAGAWWAVRLVRVAPRELDSDNLERAFKSVRDGLAAALGVDDRDARVRYVADAAKGLPGEYAVRLELYVGGAAGAMVALPAAALAPAWWKAPPPAAGLPALGWRRIDGPELDPRNLPIAPTPNVRRPR